MKAGDAIYSSNGEPVLTLKQKAKTGDVFGESAQTFFINVRSVVKERVRCLSSCSQAFLVYI